MGNSGVNNTPETIVYPEELVDSEITDRLIRRFWCVNQREPSRNH